MPTFNKWNNLRPVTRAVEANRKWDSLRKVRSIAKLNYEFKLPAFSLVARILTTSYIVHQFNFTAPQNFTVLNWQDIVNQLPTIPGVAQDGFCLAIRYREGEVVHRYRFNTMEGVVINEPFYNGELIKPNFVLEIWTNRIYTEQEDPTVVFLTNPSDITFTSSILFDPEDPNDENNLIPVVEEASDYLQDITGDLFINLIPEAELPLEFSDKGPFISN